MRKGQYALLNMARRRLTSPTSGPMEYAPFEDTFSPYIHRLNQAIRHRAVHSGEPLPDTPPILTKFSAPDEELVKGAKREIDQLVKVAEVKKGSPPMQANKTSNARC